MASGSAPWRALAPHFLSLLRLIAGLLLLEFGTMKILHFPWVERIVGVEIRPDEGVAIPIGSQRCSKHLKRR